MSKRVLVCGITGSIGKQAILVIEKIGYELVGFSFFNNLNEAKKIKEQFKDCKFYYSEINKEFSNVSSYDELIEKSKPDIVLNAITGIAGLIVSIKTIEKKIDLALANKESLVVAGWYLNNLIDKTKVKVYPVDSEHSSLYKSFFLFKDEIDEVYLTASGGPFYEITKDLAKVSFAEAIKHPKWNMGYKISIDSATLINKYFEIIEAYYLFGIEKIKAIRHKQSLVHGILKLKNNLYSFLATEPNMEWAIQQALTKYDDKHDLISPLDFNNLTFDFEEIDDNKWIPIKWAKEFLKYKNKTIPIIINAANEASIELFKNQKIGFLDIIKNINIAINHFKNIKVENLEDIYYIDKIVREFVKGKN